MQISRPDIHAPNFDVSANFGSPESLLSDPRFTDQEKGELLERWRFEAEALEVATDEGMTGDEPTLLRRVLQAIEKLNQKK